MIAINVKGFKLYASVAISYKFIVDLVYLQRCSLVFCDTCTVTDTDRVGLIYFDTDRHHIGRQHLIKLLTLKVLADDTQLQLDTSG